MHARVLSLLFSTLVLVALGLPAHGQDSDGDTVPDSVDNCVTIPNAGQEDGDSDFVGDVCDNCVARRQFPWQFCDVDSDGYGGPCDCDYDGDFICQITDVGVYNTNFGRTAGVTDQDCDDITQITDFGYFLGRWGQGPGPSGLTCAGDPPCVP